MRVIKCPRCSNPLQVAPYSYLFGATRPCPFCGTLIQLLSEHRPLPAHRVQWKEQGEPWGIVICVTALLGVVILCFAVAAALQSSAFSGGSPLAGGPAADSAIATSVIECDRDGLKGRVTNKSGVSLAHVGLIVSIFENGKSTPIIKRVYQLQLASGIERGQSVEFQVLWEPEDRKAYGSAKGRLTASAVATTRMDADGSLNVDLP
jgi:hypothetical protein